jgi:glycosyltransferase involved in cell wall biosynthesis
MNVIHYTQASTAGIAWYVLNLVRAVARRDGTVYFVCPSDYEYLGHLRTDVADVRISATIAPLSEVPRIHKLWQMLVQTATGFRTALALRTESNIIHVNYPGNVVFFALPLLIAFKLIGFRSILNVHDVLPHRYLLPKPLRFLEQATLRGIYLGVDKLVVHHVGAVDVLREKFSISSGKVAVIPHGTFRLSDAPLPYKQSGNEIVALLFGHLRENKGIHLAIRAVQKLRAQGHPIKLLIAGGAVASERGYWERCRELIEAAPTGISVLDRYLEDEEVENLVAGAHIFLLPYTDYHSQSGVAALALSNGRPIVATQMGGLSEVFVHGQTGIVIEQPTAESIEKALLQTIDLGHNRLRKMGVQAFEVFNASFSWDSIAREYVDLYRGLED